MRIAVCIGMHFCLFGILAGGPVNAEDRKPTIPELYTKYEYRIPMRDGVRLFTAVYVPKDTSEKHPFILTRTPYDCAPYGVDRYPEKIGPSKHFWQVKYICVKQDVRGRWMSEGEFVNMRPHIAEKRGPRDIDESTDAYDTIDWLIKNIPNNNGRIGIEGISYPGFYTAAAAIDAHPALKVVSPQAPIMDWFIGDDWHHNGAFMVPHCFNFMARFGWPRPEPIKKSPRPLFDHGTPDGYEFFLNMGPLKNADTKYFHGEIAFWSEVLKHPNYDEFWKTRNLRPHLRNIKPAVLTVGGWFDAENLFGALEAYRSIERQSPGAQNFLVMGPWAHGHWSRIVGDTFGDATFHVHTGDEFRDQIEFPFFDYYLRDKGAGKFPEARVFETGTNTWRDYDIWPPKDVRAAKLYFHPNGKLAFEPPANEPAATAEYDEYISDPSKPVPFQEKIDAAMTPEYMASDNRFAARRTDVLTYQTDVLTEDVTLAGPLRAELFVSTSGTDSDWVVKLIDVYPPDHPDPVPNPRQVRLGNYQQLIRGDVFRGRFRKSFDKPEAFVPNDKTDLRFTIPDVCHSFRTGHRIMIQIQSTWFPLVERNPQKFVENISFANESDYQKATQRVFRTTGSPSGLRVFRK